MPGGKKSHHVLVEENSDLKNTSNYFTNLPLSWYETLKRTKWIQSQAFPRILASWMNHKEGGDNFRGSLQAWLIIYLRLYCHRNSIARPSFSAFIAHCYPNDSHWSHQQDTKVSTLFDALSVTSSFSESLQKAARASSSSTSSLGSCADRLH